MSTDPENTREPRPVVAWLPPAAAAIVAAAALYFRSVPGVILTSVLIVPASLLILIGWLFWFAYTKYDRKPTSSRVVRLRRRSTPALAVFALFVFMNGCAGLPLTARFLTVKPAFDSYVQTLEPQQQPNEWRLLDTPERIGGYTVIGGMQCGDAVLLEEVNGYISKAAGFAYLPSGPPSIFNTACFRALSLDRLAGSWYAWVEGS